MQGTGTQRTGTTCQSCGMPIEAGPYCQHCINEEGNLQAFAERLERMAQWIRRTRDGLTRTEAEAQALDHMASMPAWRDHPELHARRAQEPAAGAGGR